MRKTPETRATYMTRYRRLRRMFSAFGDPDDLAAFVGWIIERKRQGAYTKNTWWQYRAAIVHGLEAGETRDVADPQFSRCWRAILNPDQVR